ncbi:unnamed protein product [Aureobasidium pullulans]|nr:unnamed protein product [Aureobasidium pullulans]
MNDAAEEPAKPKKAAKGKKAAVKPVETSDVDETMEPRRETAKGRKVKAEVASDIDEPKASAPKKAAKGKKAVKSEESEEAQIPKEATRKSSRAKKPVPAADPESSSDTEPAFQRRRLPPNLARLPRPRRLSRPSPRTKQTMYRSLPNLPQSLSRSPFKKSPRSLKLSRKMRSLLPRRSVLPERSKLDLVHTKLACSSLDHAFTTIRRRHVHPSLFTCLCWRVLYPSFLQVLSQCFFGVSV